MSRKKVIIATGICIVLGVAVFGAYKYISAKNSKNGGAQVAEAVVGRDTIITKVTSKGEVSLLNTELVYANLVAEVEEVLVEKNDIVRKGQPIIRYKEKSKEDLERSIEKARLDVASAELALSSSKIPPTAAAVEQARLEMVNAQKTGERTKDDLSDMDREIARLSNKTADVKKELENTETLFAAGAASQKDVDDAKRALKDAEDSLETLRLSRSQKEREIDTAEETYRYKQTVYNETRNILSEQSAQNNIKQQEINLEKARLALEQLEKELADFQQELVSPINGTVTSVSVSRGEITPTDKALMEIADISDYVIKVDVNERNAAKIALGQDVNLTGAVLGDETVTGKVTKIGYIAETKQNSSGTERVVPVEITVDKGGSADVLKPGFSLDATIITAVKENVIAIPILSTLSESDGSNYVFVIKDDNTLEKRSVKLGAYADMLVEAEGVNDGEKIVAQPSVDMADGTAVTVTNRESGEETEKQQEVDA